MPEKTIYDKVEEYHSELFYDRDTLLTSVVESIEKAGLSPISVSPSQGKLLEILVGFKSAKRVLELGTLGGYSTICMARGLSSDGKLISLDINPTCVNLARQNVKRAGLEHLVEFKLGSAIDSLDELVAQKVEPFDIVFIDADKTNTRNYLKKALQLTKKGSLIMIDNMIFGGEILDYENSDPDYEEIRQTNKFIAGLDNIETTTIPMMLKKNYDGIAFILVK